MTDKPKFEVIDRRKMKAEEEQQSQPAPEAKEHGGGPRLVVNETPAEKAHEPSQPSAESMPDREFENALPPAPTAQESKEQKDAYEASAERIEDILRAQNPGLGKQPPVGFEHLVQQFYLSAMIQMGAGTQDGQRPRVDIVGARGTIDMLAVLAEKTRGNLTAQEDRVLQSVLFELRMAFLEITSMINVQNVAPPPPAGKS